jgi:hypothetical protein
VQIEQAKLKAVQQKAQIDGQAQQAKAQADAAEDPDGHAGGAAEAPDGTEKMQAEMQMQREEMDMMRRSSAWKCRPSSSHELGQHELGQTGSRPRMQAEARHGA